MTKLFLKLFIFSCLFITPLSAFSYDPCDREAKYVDIADRYKKGVFFIVKKCGVKPSYLLGTLHSDDPKITDMLGNAFSKLAYANSANFELKFGPDVTQTLKQYMYMEPDSIETLQSMVGVTDYNNFIKLLKRAQPNAQEGAFYHMRPWGAAIMLSEPPDNTDGVALDIKLQNFATQRNIPVFGLETPVSQMEIFSTMTQSQQVGLFRDVVNNYDQVQKDIKDMFDAYYAQDLTQIKALADASFDTYSDKELAARLKIEMIDKRNRKMVEAMTPKIDQGNAFIAIGALHLPGKEGVLRQLEDQGYYIDMATDPNSQE